MANEIVDELNVLIPSEYVRNYVLETGWVFTDEQKAVFLAHSALSLKEQRSNLQALQKNTGDQSLKERIAKYLNHVGSKRSSTKTVNCTGETGISMMRRSGWNFCVRTVLSAMSM